MTNKPRKLFSDLEQPLPLPPGYSEESLKRFLSTFALDGAPALELAHYLHEDFRRFVYTLGLVPDVPGRLLEIGANPYFTTVLLKKFRRYDLSCTNYFGIDGGGGQQQFESAEAGEAFTFDFKNNNVDLQDIPFEGMFDIILFCEVIEHLVTDPIGALRRIKEKLAPGGALVLTRPHVNRLKKLAKIMPGQKM